MFRKKTREVAPSLFVAAEAIVTTPATAFYQRLDVVLTEAKFGGAVRAAFAPYYEMDASKGGQPGIDPEVYCKMLMVGFFENLRSERAIASRCADSLSIRAFLHYELTEQTPHHSSLTVIARRLPLEVYDHVFALALQMLTAAQLLKGRRLGIDTSVMEANASLRSLEHRLTKERYRQYVKRLAKEAGVDVTDARAVSAFDRKRPGRKTSNKEWRNPHDPDAKIGPDKKGVTRMVYKPEHTVDLDTGAVVHVELNEGDQADGADLAAHMDDVEARLNYGLTPEAGPVPGPLQCELLVADMGYFQLKELQQLQARGTRTAIADPIPNRRRDKLGAAERQVLDRARRTLRSTTGRAFMRRRGELVERSFVHTLDHGGARRTTLRGRVNILKRYLVRAACTNLALLLRTQGGLGTLKQTWAASAAHCCALAWSHRALRHAWVAAWRIGWTATPQLAHVPIAE